MSRVQLISEENKLLLPTPHPHPSPFHSPPAHHTSRIARQQIRHAARVRIQRRQHRAPEFERRAHETARVGLDRRRVFDRRRDDEDGAVRAAMESVGRAGGRGVEEGRGEMSENRK